MFLVNSCLGLFSAAHLGEHPFSRSYGVSLPSSLTTLLPSALGFSPHLPVSVCGTGTSSIHTAFLAIGHRRLHYCPFGVRSLTPRSTSGGVRLFQCVPVLNNFGGYGIFTVCASTTPSGLALAPDLPQVVQPCLRNLGYSAIMIPVT